MLAYILAIAIALASLILYLSAFFLPELHRRDDFLWSGVGLFYALVLWVCAERITGGVLLGQSAAVALVLSFGWQTVKLRRAIAHPEEQTHLEGVSITNWIQNRLPGKKKTVTPVSEPKVPVTSPNIPDIEDSLPTQETPQAVAETNTVPVGIEPLSNESPSVLNSVEEANTAPVGFEPEIEVETDPETELTPPVSPLTPEAKRFSLKSLFGFGKKTNSPSPQTITKALDESEADEDLEELMVEDNTNDEEIEAVLVDENVLEPENIANLNNDSAEDDSNLTPTADVDPPDILIEVETVEEVEFEAFIADNDAETIIEGKIPDFSSSKEIETPKTDNEPQEESNWIDETEKPEKFEKDG